MANFDALRPAVVGPLGYLSVGGSESPLPQGLQEVEYIQCPSVTINYPYIDLDVTVGPQIEVICKCCFITPLAAYGALIGGRNNNATEGRFPAVSISSSANALRTCYGSYDSQITMTLTDIFTVDYNTDQHKMLVNGNIVATFNATLSTSNPSTLYAFAMAGYGPPSYTAGGRIYELKIRNNVSGVLIRDFVPCYTKLGHAVGLWDHVSRSFFGNANPNSYQLVAGPDIN